MDLYINPAAQDNDLQSSSVPRTLRQSCAEAVHPSAGMKVPLSFLHRAVTLVYIPARRWHCPLSLSDNSGRKAPQEVSSPNICPNLVHLWGQTRLLRAWSQIETCQGWRWQSLSGQPTPLLVVGRSPFIPCLNLSCFSLCLFSLMLPPCTAMRSLTVISKSSSQVSESSHWVPPQALCSMLMEDLKAVVNQSPCAIDKICSAICSLQKWWFPGVGEGEEATYSNTRRKTGLWQYVQKSFLSKH